MSRGEKGVGNKNAEKPRRLIPTKGQNGGGERAAEGKGWKVAEGQKKSKKTFVAEEREGSPGRKRGSYGDLKNVESNRAPEYGGLRRKRS